MVDVQVDVETLQEYRRLAAEEFGVSSPDELEVMRQGRAYYGGIITNRPITTRLTADLLWKNEAKGDNGVFISYGHDIGIGQGPANGKVLSEIILGKELSVDMREFEIPPEYIS